jgi:hypothetical protein
VQTYPGMGPNFALRVMLDLANQYVPILLSMSWTLEIATGRKFVTSDTPVVMWRKPARKDDFYGIGLATATEVRFPADPGKQLVLSRRGRPPVVDVAAHRVRHSNEFMADACHRFVLGSPGEAELSRLRLSRFRPLIRFHIAPEVTKQPDGSLKQTGAGILTQLTPHPARRRRPQNSR